MRRALALVIAVLVSACDVAITTQPPATASPSTSAVADGAVFGVRNGLTVPAGTYLSSTAGMAASDDFACGRLELYAGHAPLGPTFIADPSKPCD